MSKDARQEGNGAFGTLSRTEEGDDDDEEEDEEDDGGVWFYVNKSGFPMNEFTYNRMWNHVAKLHPDSYSMVHKVQDCNGLPEVNFPSLIESNLSVLSVQLYKCTME